MIPLIKVDIAKDSIVLFSYNINQIDNRYNVDYKQNREQIGDRKKADR